MSGTLLRLRVYAISIPMISLLGSSCPSNPSVPGTSSNAGIGGVQAEQGLAGPEGPQGPSGPPGSQGSPGQDGTNASVTNGPGITVDNGQVSLDTSFTDGRYWRQGGNVGTDPSTQFIGTTDAMPLRFRSNNRRALSLEYVERFVAGTGGLADRTYRATNTLLGYEGNTIDAGVIGATIAGGWEFEEQNVVANIGNRITADFGTICGGAGNSILSHSIQVPSPQVVGQGSTIVGGTANTTNENYAFIGGGVANTAEGGVSVIGGGQQNHISGNYGTIGGGAGNDAGILATVAGGQDGDASGEFSAIGGGNNNTASGYFGTIPGGGDNVASGDFTFAGGRKARAQHDGSFVWADSATEANFDSTANHQFSIRASGGARVERFSGAFTPTNTNAGLQVETTSTGESVWLRTANAINSTGIPVLKLNRHPNGTNGFIRGYNWDGVNAATAKFTIDKDGAYNAGGDFAEALPVLGGKDSVEPGDVLVLSEERPGMVEKCKTAADFKLAGVYSTRPGVIGVSTRDEARLEDDEIPVAITGIVPTKVSCENGPIRVGDLLTTSPTPGHAMRASSVSNGGAETPLTGTILGKAIDPLPSGVGVIRVLVMPR